MQGTRPLELAQLCVDVLRLHHEVQGTIREKAGAHWHDNDLVLASAVGTQLDAANVRRAFRKVAAIAGLDAEEWTPRSCGIASSR
jgi:hypothetical protein